MQIAQARYCVALAVVGSFTEAAQVCGVSQPSVSEAIRELERELGGALFERAAHGARLTKLGRRLLPRFQKIIDTADDVHRLAAVAKTDSVVESKPGVDGRAEFVNRVSISGRRMTEQQLNALMTVIILWLSASL